MLIYESQRLRPPKTAGAFQLGGNARLVPDVSSKLNKSGKIVPIYPTFVACGRVIVVRRWNRRRSSPYEAASPVSHNPFVFVYPLPAVYPQDQNKDKGGILSKIKKLGLAKTEKRVYYSCASPIYPPVAKLDIAVVSDSKGRGFKFFGCIIPAVSKLRIAGSFLSEIIGSLSLL